MATIELIGRWGGRAATVEQILSGSQRMLAALPPDPAGQWIRFVPGDEIEMATVPVDIDDPVSLTAAIEFPVRHGWGHMLQVDRHTGNRDFPLSVKMRVGDEQGRNNAIIQLRGPEEDSPEIRAHFTAYMDAVIDTWDPDWLEAGTLDFVSAQGGKGLPDEIYVGWRTYLSDRVALDTAALPATVTVHDRPGGGRYLTLDGTPWRPDLGQALLVRQALGQ